jgi:hypothetical protein
MESSGLPPASGMADAFPHLLDRPRDMTTDLRDQQVLDDILSLIAELEAQKGPF